MLDEARWSLVEESLKTSWDLDKNAMEESINSSMGSQGNPWSSPQDNVRLSGISYPPQVDPVAYGLSIREIQRIISQLERHRSPLRASLRELMARMYGG
jgi:hypothetical protein